MDMQPDHAEIIRRYKVIARLPDFLFAFTFPLRRRSIQKLKLQLGQAVLEVGCSSGANFAYLVHAVGPTGKVVGIDLTPEMVTQARLRIREHAWDNIQVIEAAAETVVLDRQFDALLLFAMHDVLTNPLALDNILSFLKPGACIVAAGPQLACGFPGRFFNPLIHLVYKKLSVSQVDKDRPWRLLAERVKNLQVESHTPGIMYLASGTD
jgi:ubiquinone/menaquinone biosynthesis C-methylase UbiE